MTKKQFDSTPYLLFGMTKLQSLSVVFGIGLALSILGYCMGW